MRHVLWSWCATAALASSLHAAELHEVFLEGFGDPVPNAVEIALINTHSELTLLVADATPNRWGNVQNDMRIDTAAIDGSSVLLSDGAFPTDFGAFADPGNTRTIIDVSADDPRVRFPNTSPDKFLNLEGGRLLVLLEGSPGQNLAGVSIEDDEVEVGKQIRGAAVLDIWGYDAQPAETEVFPGVFFPTKPAVDASGELLTDVYGSSVLVRNPEDLSFVHGNEDPDRRGYLKIAGDHAGDQQVRISPGVANTLFTSSTPGGSEVIPEPAAAGLVGLGLVMTLLRRPMLRDG